MTRIFLDTEFMENGETIKPLAVALTTGDRHLYLVITDVDRSEANSFVREHVLQHLDKPYQGVNPTFCPKAAAPHLIMEWVGSVSTFHGEWPEFWAYYGAYDWVLVCQLFGNMTDLPFGWPMFIRDTKQLQQMVLEQEGPDFPNPPEMAAEDRHHALADALNVKAWYDYYHPMLGPLGTYP